MRPYYQDAQVTIYHADSVEALASISESFDLVIADPPYTTGIASFGEDTKASGWGDIMNSSHFNAAWLRSCMGQRMDRTWWPSRVATII